MNLEAKVQDYLGGDPFIVNENANKDGSLLTTQRDLLAGTVSKEYALERMLPPRVADAHRKGWIHYHDLDYEVSPASRYNCMLADFPSMLRDGFMLGEAHIEQPRSLRTAVEVLMQAIANISSSMYGGLSAHRLDEFLEPYAVKSFVKHFRAQCEAYEDYAGISFPEGAVDDLVSVNVLNLSSGVDSSFWNGVVDTPEPNLRRFEGLIPNVAQERIFSRSMSLTVKEVYDSCQALQYSVNCLHTSNGQTPFITFNFGLGLGCLAREIQKAVLQVAIDGLGPERKGAVFPKLVFTLAKGVNKEPGDKNYDVKLLALECASKRIYPDVLDYDNVVSLYGMFVSPMGCRSFLPYYENPVTGEPQAYGRRNVGVVTVNLPNVALTSESVDDFWRILDERLQIVKEALDYRFDRLRSTKAKNAPILYMNGATGHRLDAESPVQQIFENKEASISVGYIGLYETATRFFGPNWEDNVEAKQFTLEVLKRINWWRDKWYEDGWLYASIYATPSESLTDRFSRIDRDFFGEVKDITDKGYYTNSFHYDVRKQVSPFEKIAFESEYIPHTTGGNIMYVESHNLSKNLKALEDLWEFFSSQGVPYFGVNQPVSHCYECEYDGDMDADVKGFYCPQCDNRDASTLHSVSRVCGYLTVTSSRKPVEGRVKEIMSRVKHM